MRITTGMLGRHNNARGTIASRKSLLDYVRSNRTGGSSRLKAMGNTRSSATLQRLARAGDEKLKTDSDSLISAGKTLGAKVDSGSEDVSAEVERVISAYNAAVDSLQDTSGTLNQYYHQMMKQAASDNMEELAGIGISINSRGKLTLDKEKFEKADQESVKKLLGSEGDFTKRASFVASRVYDNAQTSAQSIANRYDSRGDILNSYLSRYNFRG